MALALVVIGLLLWLLGGLTVVGIVVMVLGLVLVFVPAVPGGYGSWRR